MRIPFALLLVATLSGCVARTAFDVVTAPVRAGIQVADWMTVSEDERDDAFVRTLREDCDEWKKSRKRAIDLAYDTGDWSTLPDAPNDYCRNGEITKDDGQEG
ncbi:MAG: hypothetical protein WA906_01720 [Pacificimonas sp.]